MDRKSYRAMLDSSFFAPRADQWSKLTDADVLALAAHTNASRRNARRIAWAAGLVNGLAAFAGALMSDAGRTHIGLLLAWAAMALLATTYLVGALTLQFLTEEVPARQMQELLQPLKAFPAYCQDALARVQKHAVARAYRDEVVSRGRELLWADHLCIEAMARQEEARVQQERSGEVCRALHGLASA